MNHQYTVQKTLSVCPVCLEQIPAERRRYADGHMMLWKKCPEHGVHEDLIWSGYLDAVSWREKYPELACSEDSEEAPDCAHCDGLCEKHRQNTCCTLLEVTRRCNMHCNICFADPDHSEDPSLDKIKDQISDLTVPGSTFLQLSGGEPTVRDDLTDIISWAVEGGCKYIQLNTNGIRLAQEPDYVRRLADSGLSFVFLQFDGVTDDVYRKIRGRDLLEIKEKAIENCNSCGIGVTLVPTIVKGINDAQIGSIISYGIAHSPAVRGIHFQPASYFGRMIKIPGPEDRYTLDHLVYDIVQQNTHGLTKEMILPSACDHPMCGFHGDFVVLPEQQLFPLSKHKKPTNEAESCCCCGDPDPETQAREAMANREFIGRRWKRMDKTFIPQIVQPDPIDMTDMDTFLQRIKSHGFTITSMAFQDAGNLDIERMRRCSLHVYRDGKKRPFCAEYLSAWERQ